VPVLVSAWDLWPRKVMPEASPVIVPEAAPARAVVAMTGERIACRSEKMADLARETGNQRRDAITRLWVLSGCKACGQCADMAAR